jgi:hypothetical protein
MSGFKIPTNTWMNDGYFLAFMAHSGWACLYLLSVDIYGSAISPAHTIIIRAVATALMIAFAAVKEFVYDARFEIPKQTSFDNWTDFGGYCAGLALAWGLLLGHAALLR